MHKSECIQSDITPASPEKQKHLFTFFKSTLFKSSLKLGLTFFFVILVNRSLKQNDFQLIIGRISPFSILIALMLSGLSFYFQLMRWQVILRSQSLPCGIQVAAKTMLIGSFLAFLTPGRIGEFFKGVGTFSDKKAVSVLAVVIERFYGIFLTVTFGLISVIIQFFSFNINAFVYFEILLAVSFVLFCSAGFLLRIISGKIAEIRLFKSASDMIRLSASKLHTLPVRNLLLFSALSQLCLILQTAILLEMFGSGNFLKNCIIAGQAYALMLFVPFLVANIGIREFSFALFLRKLEPVSSSTPQAAAVAFGVSGLILLINVIFPAVFGLLWMLKGNRDRKSHCGVEFSSVDKAE